MNILQVKKYSLQRRCKRKVIEQAKFTYSPLGKALEKQTKTNEDQGKKQIQVLKSLNLANEKECEKVKHELRVTNYEFKSTSYELKSTSYEFKFTSYEFKFTS